MDTEDDINMAAEKIMKDITVSKLDALNMLLGRYQRRCRRGNSGGSYRRSIERSRRTNTFAWRWTVTIKTTNKNKTEKTDQKHYNEDPEFPGWFFEANRKTNNPN